MSIYKRCFILTFGLFFVAFGLAATSKSLLGNSPISSIPYVLSMQYHFSFGMMNSCLNLLFVLIQIMILKRNFKLFQLLQIAMAFVFGYFIDISMYILNNLTPEIYIAKLAVLLAGVTILAFGVALQVIADIIMLPADNVVKVIAEYWDIDFGYTKTIFDVSMVIIAAACSWSFFHNFYGIREGTLVAAMLTGTIARFSLGYLKDIISNNELSLDLKTEL